MGLQAGLGRAINFEDDGLAGGNRTGDHIDWGIGIAAENQIFVFYFGVEGADDAPDNGILDKAAALLELLVQAGGGFGVAKAAQPHADTGHGATVRADGGVVAETKLGIFPARVLLGKVDELEGHG